MNRESVKTQAATLEGFVKDNLTASQFERLHELLGITKNAVTSMFRNPSASATIDNVQDLARLCGVEPRTLVMKYGMGMGTIFLAEAHALGLQISQIMGGLATVRYQIATYSGAINVNFDDDDDDDKIIARAKRQLIQKTGPLPFGYERFTVVSRLYNEHK